MTRIFDAAKKRRKRRARLIAQTAVGVLVFTSIVAPISIVYSVVKQERREKQQQQQQQVMMEDAEKARVAVQQKKKTLFDHWGHKKARMITKHISPLEGLDAEKALLEEAKHVMDRKGTAKHLSRMFEKSNNRLLGGRPRDLPEDSTTIQQQPQQAALENARSTDTGQGEPLSPQKHFATEMFASNTGPLDVAQLLEENHGRKVSQCNDHPRGRCDPDKDKPVFVYNPFYRDRHLCGQVVAANQSIQLLQSCQEPSRLYPTNPPLDRAGMDPITIVDAVPLRQSQKQKQQQQQQGPFPCDIPCRKDASKPFPVAEWAIQGTNWSLRYSLESSRYYKKLKIDPVAYQRDMYWATTSFRSEVPLPYFSWAEYDLQKQPAVRYDEAIHGASFLASNCLSLSGREKVVEDLQDYIRVDSLGRCKQNAKPPKGLTRESPKNQLQREYLFHLAFENSLEPDYITEKLWGTLKSGTLPVYLGADNVRQHAPPGSIISWHDYNDTKKLGEYLRLVADNATLYESHHEWRRKPLPPEFVHKFNFTHTHSICRICRWSHARMHGFGWDHNSQAVQELHMPRHVCVDPDGFIVHPFVELSKTMTTTAVVSLSDCQPIQGPVSKILGSHNRTVWVHDGVIDIELEQTRSRRRTTTDMDLYQIQVDIPRGEWSELSPQHFRLQDEDSRITFLVSSKDETVAAKGEWLVRFAVTESVKIRIIIEDVDKFHEEADEVPTYYGRLMEQDFFQPMQFYYGS